MGKLLFFLCFILSSTSLWAADIYTESNRNSHHLYIDGVIRDGDAERFAKEMSKLPWVNILWLNSPGGSVVEALRIAKLVKYSNISIHIKERSDCVSACFFVWLAGLSRNAVGVDGGGLVEPPSNRDRPWMSFVGIHRPYIVDKDLIASRFLKNQVSAMDYVREYLSDNGVPLYLIDEMMAKPSNQVYWLKNRDLDAIGYYRPEIEELLIRDCGYERDYYWKYRDNPQKKNYIMDCESKIVVSNFQYIQDNIISKLKSGWRPW
ncbi:hypothetical protein [Malikia sp.]|uniref:COG3904 family protein n=1 Tax=Malikia sp. TaxID=2070706 RepID=UPI002622E688|nr:hypothetical protein [Malikia sp.]MDD2729759.1 hypothetical protein [Malikia sp.]